MSQPTSMRTRQANAADPSAAHAHRPWPVVVLTALGAWFSLVPLLMVLALLFEQSWRTGPGPYVCGVLLLGGALTVMRSRGLSLFMEQLAWPVLLLGLGAMAFGFARDFSLAGACVALSLTALLLSCLVPQPSLRALLGAATLQMATLAWAEVGGWRETQSRVAWAVHIAVLAVAALMYTRDVWAARDRTAPAVLAWSNSVLGGAAVAALASLASWSGMAMLLPAALGGNPSGAGGWQASADGAWLIWAGISAGAALLGAACLWRAWPAWRQPWWAGVLLALAGLSFLMPGLGLALAWLALCLLSSRPKLAAWSLAVTAWIISAFYYTLAWPLSSKAVMLAAAGLALGALGWWGVRQATAGAAHGEAGGSAKEHTRAMPADQRGRGWLLLACAVGALALVNHGIWQKETLIREGQPVFVPLAPVDPRSLMQGDYMALRFALPPAPDARHPAADLAGGRRWYAVGQRDARGVLTLQRHDHGQGQLAAHEMRIELTPKPRGWTIATDAWFFAEGDAARWAQARYGEFRVDAQGRALLVGLRDEALRPIRTDPVEP